MEELPLFRAPKRRKTTQIRDANNDPSLPRRMERAELEAATDTSDQDAVSNLVRVRKAGRTARTGVTFSTNARLDGEQMESTALIPTSAVNDRPRDMSTRFVGSTGGQGVDVDDHMMAYIDSEMAKRRQATPVASTQNIKSAVSTSGSHPQSTTQDKAPTQPQAHQLSEVDLSSLAIPPKKPTASATTHRPPRKPRLGRDGKPLRPRPRKRRNSEDLARDALVEQVLHEHRLENVYQPPNPGTGPEPHSTTELPAGNASRDEAFAERFRQDFLDQVAERRQAQQQKKTAAAGAGAAVEKTQGPKLGGSRAARARMAATQQQQGVGGAAQK